MDNRSIGMVEVWKMNEYPLVSIIIISYRHEKYIDDCMESLMQLTYPNIQLFYLDDCSSDSTYDKAYIYKDKLEKRFSQVNFVQNKSNKGLVNNLNALIPKCTGKYIKFLAADDFLIPRSMHIVVDYMEQHPEYDMLYTNALYGDGDTHISANLMEQLPTLYSGEQPKGKKLFDKLYERDFIAAPTVVVRREVYDRVGLYDVKLGTEDWDFFLRVAQKGSIGYLDKPTVMYRFTNTSLSHSDAPTRRMNMQKSELLIREKYRTVVRESHRYIERSFNAAYQDALHIDDEGYFAFLDAYATRNQVKISMKNRIRYILYKLHVFKIIDC